MPGPVGPIDGEADFCWCGRRLRIEEDGSAAVAGQLPLGEDKDQRIPAGLVGGGVVDDDQIREGAGRPRSFAVFGERYDGA